MPRISFQNETTFNMIVRRLEIDRIPNDGCVYLRYPLKENEGMSSTMIQGAEYA